MEEVKIRLAPITKSQKESLTDFMKHNQDLQSGRFSKTFTKKHAQELWKSISRVLNAMPGGAFKDWYQWRKTWQDLKKHAKSKASKSKTCSISTGVVPAEPNRIKEDNDALNKIPPLVLIKGNIPVEESTFPNSTESFVFVDVNDSNNINDASTSQKRTYAEMKGESYCESADSFSSSEISMKHTKAQRLERSIHVSQELYKVERERKDILNRYYTEKIKYLQHRKAYEERKISMLKENNEISRGILNQLHKISDVLEKN